MADTYSLEIISEKQIVLKTDKVTENYSLESAPPPEYSLVQMSRKNILQTIRLDELFDNLDNCVSLLDITYNAVNGMGLSSSVTALKDKFSNTLDNSLVVMVGFKTGTESAVADFITSYKFLTNPIYKKGKKNGILMAIDKLTGVGQKAVQMESEATTLAATFDQIETTAQEITKKIMDERDMDVKKREEAVSRLKVLQGKVDALKEVKDDLDSEVEEYSQQYSNLSTKIERDEKKAFTLSLVSAVLGGLSSMFGGGGIPETGNGGQGAGGSSGSSGQPDPMEEKYKESQKKVKEHEDKVKEYDTELAQIKEQIEKETDEAKKKELSDKQDQLTRDKQQEESMLEKERAQSDVYKNALSGIAGGLGKTSDELNKMAQKMDDKNVSQYARLDKIAEQKTAVQKERRQTIQQLSEMTSEIENATTESRDLDMCISALITAVGCMRIVKVYLSDIALFWKNVAKFCNGMVENIKGLNEEIGNFSDIEDYCELFLQQDFINAYLLNVVSWVALHQVSIEYLDAFNKTRAKYQDLEKIGEADPKEHWKRAKDAAAELNGKLKEEMKEC